MVGSLVGEDEIGGLFQPPELRRNTGAARAAPSWKPSHVNRPPFLGRPIASMAGELTTRMMCLVSAPSSERWLGHLFLSLNDEPELSILGS